MFLVGNLPPLDGTRIVWSDYRGQDIASIVLWIVMLVVLVLLIRFLKMERMKKVFTGLSLFLTAVLLSTLVVVGIQNDGLARKPETVVTKNEEFTLSEDQNLIVFVLDATDSKTFLPMLEESPEYQEMLGDFTYYANTVCAYPYTKHSIPFLLTGQWYENDRDFREYSTEAMDSSPLLTTLRQEGYRMGLYEEELIDDSDAIFDYENVTTSPIRFRDFSGVAKAELKLVWFKYAPFPLKRLAHVDMERFNQLLELADGVEVFQANNQDFYKDVETEDVTICEEKCFRFIHIEGAHVPFRYDENVNLIDSDTGSYTQNLQCTMTILSAYLQKLKDAGVYDSSAIVVLADHGYGEGRDIPVLGRFNPFLAVKGVGEHHDLTISEAPISYEDLQEAYARLLRGETEDAIFDAKEGEERPRRVLSYYYQKDEHMAEYIQYGHASDETTLKPTGTVYTAPGFPELSPPTETPTPTPTPTETPTPTPTPTSTPTPTPTGHGPHHP